VSTTSSGPRLLAPVDVGSYPSPAADGRLWKYCQRVAVGVGERLADQAAADHLPGCVLDHGAVRM